MFFINTQKTVLLSILIGFVLIVGGLLIYSFYFFSNDLVKVPLGDNIFFARNAGDQVTELDLFNEYLTLMSKDNYKYLPEDRAGGLLSFEKKGQRVTVVYPKFIRLK